MAVLTEMVETSSVEQGVKPGNDGVGAEETEEPVAVEPEKKKKKKKKEEYRTVLGQIRSGQDLTEVWIKISKTNKNFTTYNVGLLQGKHLKVTVTQRGKALKEWVNQTKKLSGKATMNVVGIWVCAETDSLKVLALCSGCRIIIFRNADPTKVPLAFQRFLQMKDKFMFVHCNNTNLERVINWLQSVIVMRPFEMKMLNLVEAYGMPMMALITATFGYQLEGLELPHHQVWDQNIRDYCLEQIGRAAIFVYFVCEIGKAGLAQQPKGMTLSYLI